MAYGCGALVAALAGRPLGALTLPLGLALAITALDVAVRVSALRPAAVVIVLVLALAGLALRIRPWQGGRLRERLPRPSPWQAAAALGVFAIFAAPVVLSGQATFTGYIKLDDTATFFALTDSAFSHGTSAAGLAPSSYEETLRFYLGAGYPLGSFLPLGIGHSLLRQDIAWLYSPYLAFLAAMLALALESIAAIVVRVAWQRAGIAFIAAQAALLYGYVLWGGVKELAAAMLVATFAATCPAGVSLLTLRAWVAPLVVAAAMIAANTVGGLIWLLPIGAGALLVSVQPLGLRRVLRSAAPVPALLGVAAIVISLTGGGFIQQNLTALRGGNELGNLIAPLNGLQVLGLWPTGDFRIAPSHLSIAHALVALVALAAAAGIVAAALARAWMVVLYIAGVGVAALAIALLGSPWLGGKALATASPAFLFAALVGAALLGARGRRPEALIVAALIAAGVLWSNALAYHDVSLAPRAQLGELARIGGRIAGQGPTLMTEYQPYGVRHFLRGADAEGASELRVRLVQLRNGQTLPKGAYADLNQFDPSAVLVYRTLVLRRSPLESRPPAAYTRIFSGRYYDVWQRPAGGYPAIVADRPLGTGTGALPACADVRALATGRAVALAAAPAPVPAPASIALASYPGEPWPAAAGDPGQVALDHPASLAVAVDVPAAGRYAVWLGGAARGTVSVSVDGTIAGRVHDQLQYAGQFSELGERNLAAGPHTVRLRYGGSGLGPGSGGPPASAGPLVLAPAADPAPLLRVAPAAAATLCGRRLYWVEALSG